MMMLCSQWTMEPMHYALCQATFNWKIFQPATKTFVCLHEMTDPGMLPHSKGSIEKDKQQILNFSRTLDFLQLIKEPTRVTEKSRILIDLVLVNN